MICDATQPLQVSVCNIRCRSEWFTTGECIKVGNAPVCQCSSSTAPPVTTTTSGASIVTTTSTANPVTGSNINYIFL
jgi:hypothetical protein